MTDTEPRKRRRPAKSCEQCRQRKVRCDRNVPCGPCTRARSSLGCSYRRVSRSPSPTDHQASPLISHEPQRNARGYPLPSGMPDGSTGSLDETPHIGPQCGSKECISSQLGSTIRDLQLRLQRLEEQLTSPDIARPSAPEPDIQQALRELCDKVQSLEQRLLCTQSTQAPKGELAIAAAPPRLHSSSKKMKLFGPTHYMHTMDKLQLVGSLETRGPQPLCPEFKAELTAQIKELHHLRGSVKAAQSPRLNNPVPDLLSTIPARSVCDELVQCYLRTFESIYRIVHIPSFNKEYQQFWDHPPATPTPFLMKLALILAIGTTFHPQRGKAGKEYDTRLIQTWIYAAQWWLTGPTEKNTFNLDGLQIFCLLLLARQLGSPGPSLYLSAASLLQTATAMGLHRDSAHFPSLSPFQSEMRARLWTTVLELTLQSSLDSASPIPIPYFDTKPPSNLNDTDIHPDLKHLPTPHPKTTHTDTSLQLLLHDSFTLRAETIHLIHSPITIPYQKALDLTTKLRTTCHTITTTTSPQSFHHSHLLTTLTRYILHLHLPFARAAHTTPQYHYSRKLCLEAALTIASFAPTTSSTNPPSVPISIPLDNDFPLLTLTARGPLRGPLNLDVICTLALELITQIEEAPDITNTPNNSNNSPLSMLASTIRTPILHTLSNLALQSAHVLEMHGKSPALKRYIISRALVAQIRALEGGGGAGAGDVQGVVYEAVRGCLRDGVGMLRGMEKEGIAEGLGMFVTPDSGAGAGAGGLDGMGEGLRIGMGLDDLEGWDLASFLYAPGLVDLGGW